MRSRDLDLNLIRKCAARLQQLTRHAVDFLAYPGGRFIQCVMETAAAAVFSVTSAAARSSTRSGTAAADSDRGAYGNLSRAGACAPVRTEQLRSDFHWDDGVRKADVAEVRA